MEVKAAYRFDVAGCATLFNETIEVTETSLHVSASCAETQETKIFYDLQFEFWGKVNATSYKFDRKPVGKFAFRFDKLERPARWRQLYKEGTSRPTSMKLDIDGH